MKEFAPVTNRMTWVFKRLIPGLLLTLLSAGGCGLIRGSVFFVPGIMGMACGGLMGYAIGRIGRSDHPSYWVFSTRGGLTLGSSLLYALGAIAVLAIFRAGPIEFPMDWIAELLSGHTGEPFVGTSVNSYQSVSGVIKGFWWYLFIAVDMLLYAFLFLISLGIGLSKPSGSQSSTETSNATKPANTRLGLFSFGTYLVFILLIAVTLFQWPLLKIDSSQLVNLGDLQGEWIFEPEAVFKNDSQTARRFTLSIGLGDDLAGYAQEQGRFMVVVKQGRNGFFQGQILFRDRGSLPVQMQVLPDGRHLLFTLQGVNRSGIATKRQITATRFD